jgi:uncharacterized protein (DUF488 family)
VEQTAFTHHLLMKAYLGHCALSRNDRRHFSPLTIIPSPARLVLAAWTLSRNEVAAVTVSERLFTIGHSNHPIERFIHLLRMHGITAVGDVRSSPYSRHNPQFTRETLQKSLQHAGIAYLYFGDALGARSADSSCFRNGAVRFDLVAQTTTFQHGLEQVRSTMATERLALMCAEKDPLQCHRTVLICRNLRRDPFSIDHIRADGSIETRQELEERLLVLMKIAEGDLFLDREQRINRAYDLLARSMTDMQRNKGFRSRGTDPS